MKNLGFSSTIEYFITALGNGEPFSDIDSVSLLQLGRGDRNPLSGGQRLRCHGLHAGGSGRFPAPGSRRTLRDSVWMFPEAFAAQREQLWGDCLVRRPQPGLPPRLLEPHRSVCAQGPQGGVSSYTCPRPPSSAVELTVLGQGLSLRPLAGRHPAKLSAQGAQNTGGRAFCPICQQVCSC